MCETYREVSEEGTEGAQNRPRQDVPHWHVDYFEVKAIETLQPKEKLLSLL